MLAVGPNPAAIEHPRARTERRAYGLLDIEFAGADGLRHDRSVPVHASNSERVVGVGTYDACHLGSMPVMLRSEISLDASLQVLVSRTNASVDHRDLEIGEPLFNAASFGS